MELTKEKIDFIKEEVKKTGVKFSHLQDDLVDHICTLVEEEMKKDADFNEAFNKVKNQIGFKNLKEIEVDTLITLNQHLVKTKKRISGIGVFTVLAIIIGLIMKTQHIEVGNYLFLLGMLSLAVIYLPMYFIYNIKKAPEKKNVLINIFGFIAAFITAISFVFVGMVWTYKSYAILISIISIVCFLIVYLIHTLRNPENRITNLSIILFLFIFLFFEMSGFYFKKTSKRGKLYTIETNINESIAYYQQRNLKYIENAFALDSTRSQIRILIDETNKIIDQVNTLKEVFKKNMRINSKGQTNIFISDDMPYFAEDYNSKLEKSIQEYCEITLNYARTLEISGLDTFIKKSLTWANINFYNPSIITYNNLLNLHRNILIIEGELLASGISE